MTDQELCIAAIGGAWPKEALPKGLRRHTAGWFINAHPPISRISLGKHAPSDEQYCNDETTAALFRDSGLAWLVTNDKMVKVWSCVDHISDDGTRSVVAWVVGLDDADMDETPGHPTLLAAIDQAIRAL